MAPPAAMPALPEEISEKHIIGRESREWLVGPGEVAGLDARRVEWAGVSDLAAPYEVVRHAPAFGHVLGCIGGEGEVWVGGGWQRVVAGMVFVNPPGAAEALRACPGERWQICWVHTRPGFFAAAAGGPKTPFLAELDARPLWHALEGLRLCLEAEAKDALAESWCELVFAHAHRLGVRRGGAQRLGRVWEEVTKAPAEPWDVARLSALAGMSREQLRRMAVAESGRTPMEQVTYLRMRRAASLLRLTNQTLDAVAEAVGYGNAFVFSNAFLRVAGLRPGAYRAAATAARGKSAPGGQ